MIFERTSVRTRVSFEFGIQMLGGIAISLTKEDIGIGTRETVEDIALAMSRYADIVMYRALDKKDLHEFARHATIPVINGLDIDEHPTQILADLTTIKEKKYTLKGLKFVFVGDGDDNHTHSYMLGCTLMGMDFTVISPRSHWPSNYFLEKATELSKEKHTKLIITEDQPFRPFIDRTRLRDDDQVGTVQRQGSHVFREVAVVADRHAKGADAGPIDRGAGIARRVVALLVEAGVISDVNHPRDTQQRAIGAINAYAHAIRQIQDLGTDFKVSAHCECGAEVCTLFRCHKCGRVLG